MSIFGIAVRVCGAIALLYIIPRIISWACMRSWVGAMKRLNGDSQKEEV